MPCAQPEPTCAVCATPTWPQAESVTKVDAVIFFQAMLKGRAKIVMETPVHISYDSGLPGKGLYTAGVAGFKQMAALPVKGG